MFCPSPTNSASANDRMAAYVGVGRSGDALRDMAKSSAARVSVSSPPARMVSQAPIAATRPAAGVVSLPAQRARPAVSPAAADRSSAAGFRSLLPKNARCRSVGWGQRSLHLLIDQGGHYSCHAAWLAEVLRPEWGGHRCWRLMLCRLARCSVLWLCVLHFVALPDQPGLVRGQS